jgi:pyruvate formate lyase activating enzyme
VSAAPADDGNQTGVVFNVQKFSLHDGEGIRTLVFLKGCPLACLWCANPEGRSGRPELLYNPDRCIKAECDGTCATACKAGAIHRQGDGAAVVAWDRCDGCGKCVDACPARAMEVVGRTVTADEIVERAEQDAGFYARSGGGLTLSGGEPLSQARFVEQVLKKAQARGLDTAIETTGFCSFEALERTAPHLDLVIYDVKCFDPERHRRTTGVTNEKVLDNFKRLRRRFPDLPVAVRTPVIPGVNDSEEEIGAIARFVAENGGAPYYELLPYHRFGELKYERTGKAYPLPDLRPPTGEEMDRLRRAAARHVTVRDEDGEPSLPGETAPAACRSTA